MVRNCATRSSNVHAIGEIISVSTPLPGTPQAIPDDVLRPDQRDRVDQLARQRRGRLVLATLQVEILDLARGVLVAVALDQGVVEVLLARAHPADVQRDVVAHRVTRGLAVVADHGGDGRHDREVVEALAAAGPRKALFQQRPELAHVLGREQRRQPAVGDLGRQRRVLRPDRGDVDRDPVLDGGDRELERLPGPSGSGSSSVSPSNTTRSRPSAIRTTATYSRVRCSCLANRCPCQPSATCGPLEPMPSSMRPSESWSIVAAVIAVIAALRPGIWKIAEPSLIVVVACASQARIVAASEP